MAHSRPYTFESREILEQFISQLENKNIWYYTLNNRNLIRTAELKTFADDFIVYNNLPPVEFDETGFVGRENDIENIKKLIDSHVPVISIIGTGGVGKTALALKIVYDIVNKQK